MNQTQSSGAEDEEEGEDKRNKQKSSVDEEENEESPTNSEDGNDKGLFCIFVIDFSMSAFSFFREVAFLKIKSNIFSRYSSFEDTYGCENHLRDPVRY